MNNLYLTLPLKKLPETYEIEDFIESFRNYPGATELFTQGKCYWFALILKERFETENHLDNYSIPIICYDPILGHFYTAIECADRKYHCFDITGELDKTLDPKEIWAYLQFNTDPDRAKRIERDCIL